MKINLTSNMKVGKEWNEENRNKKEKKKTDKTKLNEIEGRKRARDKDGKEEAEKLIGGFKMTVIFKISSLLR